MVQALRFYSKDRLSDLTVNSYKTLQLTELITNIKSTGHVELDCSL
jgi:hypothetical protein